MSGKTRIIALLLVSIAITYTPMAFSTTNCEQTFTFFGVTWDIYNQNKITFWVGEDVSGECMGSHLIQVTVSDTTSCIHTAYNVNYANWDWLRHGFSNLSGLTLEKLSNKEGSWSDSAGSLRISAPPSDTLEIRKIYQSSYEAQWTARHGIEAIKLPQIQEVLTKLIYYYPVGLYVDYKISDAYYIPSQKLLIVFTHQPHLAAGFDSMHGFLIFRIIK